MGTELRELYRARKRVAIINNLPRWLGMVTASSVANAQTHPPTCGPATISNEIVAGDSHIPVTVVRSTDLRPIAGQAASVNPGTLIFDPVNGPEPEPITIRTANAGAIAVGSSPDQSRPKAFAKPICWCTEAGFSGIAFADSHEDCVLANRQPRLTASRRSC